MKLQPESVAFGRHETFPLRFSWLPKGFQALEQNPKVFEEDDATVHLGVGKNMVSAIRYWLRASQMIAVDSYAPTELGELILSEKDGFDPYLEDEGTIWLLHWLIASNPGLATTFFWFFNRFHKSEFTSEELNTALADFLQDELPANKRPAKNTIKNDVQVLPRMYTQSKITARMPLEDALDSPFSVLKLIEHKSGDRVFVSRNLNRPSLPFLILGFSVISFMNERGVQIVPIEDLMYSRDEHVAPGSIFRISENDFLRKLELLVQAYPTELNIRESSGIHQLYITAKLDPLSLLSRYYGVSAEVAA